MAAHTRGFGGRSHGRVAQHRFAHHLPPHRDVSRLNFPVWLIFHGGWSRVRCVRLGSAYTAALLLMFIDRRSSAALRWNSFSDAPGYMGQEARLHYEAMAGK